jgi:hypothetical protein
MKKHIIFLLLLLPAIATVHTANAALATGAEAQTAELSSNTTYSYMTFRLTSGDEISFALTNFRITFSSDSVYTQSEGNTTAFATSDVAKMNFSETPTGISKAYISKESISYDGDNTLTIHYQGSATKAVLYSSAGVRLKAYDIVNGENSIGLSDIPRGVYLITIDGKAVKIMKR